MNTFSDTSTQKEVLLLWEFHTQAGSPILSLLDPEGRHQHSEGPNWSFV